MVHAWEDWGDARAYDGTVSLLQPQALPLYDGLSPHQVLALLDAPPEQSRLGDTLPIVQATWEVRLGGQFESSWHDSLAAGVVPDTAAQRVNPKLRTEVVGKIVDGARRTVPDRPDRPDRKAGLTVLFRPDPYVWDGRHANNPWLQELPRPLTKLTWDNPLLIAPALAGRLGLVNGDEVRLGIEGAHVEAPVWILPGVDPSCVVALLGFGRQRGGAVAEGSGLTTTP